MGFIVHIIEKIRLLIKNQYGFHYYDNRANYLKFLQTGWILCDPNPNEVYEITINILQLILPILSSQKLADLLC